MLQVLLGGTLVNNSSVKKMKVMKQFFQVVLFSTLYKVVLTFKSVDETPVCHHSNESYGAVIPCGIVCYVVQSECTAVAQVCRLNGVWSLRVSAKGLKYIFCLRKFCCQTSELWEESVHEFFLIIMAAAKRSLKHSLTCGHEERNSESTVQDARTQTL